jgi:hypothetical protein
VLFDRPRRLPVKDGIIEESLPAYGTLVVRVH